MGEQSENVINFTLSKDINLPLTIAVHSLSGVKASWLLKSVAQIGVPDDTNISSSSITDVLIRHKLRREVLNMNIICNIYVESRNGKRLTMPLVNGLSISSEDSLQYGKESEGLEDKALVFTPLSNLSVDKEWIKLPINYNQLPLDAVIIVKIYGLNAKSGSKIWLGEGRSEIFNNECSMKMGKHKIPIFTKDNNGQILNVKLEDTKLDNFELNETRPKWLNQFTKRKLLLQDRGSKPITNLESSNMAFLIEFPYFESPVVYSDIKYAAMILPSLDLKTNDVTIFGSSFNEISYNNLKHDHTSLSNYPSMTPFDPDTIRMEHTEDPVEQKFRRLERTQHLSPLDKDTKPTFKIRTLINKIMSKQYFEKISAKERNIVWKYRWFLLNNLVLGNKSGWNNFTVNFIKCVDWNNTVEVKEFESILTTLSDNAMKKAIWLKTNFKNSSGWWVFEQELEIVDCLELLTGIYKNKIIRQMAINRLSQASDDDLCIFMVQLVQNIKHDVLENEKNDLTNSKSFARLFEVDQSINEEVMDGSDSEEGRGRSLSSSNYTNGSSDYQFVDRDISKNDVIIEIIDKILSRNSTPSNLKLPNIFSPLVDFLVKRAIDNPKLINSFYWCLKVESEEEELAILNINMTNKTYQMHESQTPYRRVYELAMKKFIIKLASSNQGIQKVYELRRQIELVQKLHDFCTKLKFDYKKETTPKKVEILKHLLTDKQKRTIFSGKSDPRLNLTDDHKHETMLEFPPIAMPLDPNIIVDGIFPDDSSVFKSSLSPIKVSFKTAQGLCYPVMYKIGDDLRQDQFITQLISLMEKILENENMDMKLRPYKILATGPIEGFIQFIPNSSLSSILARYSNSILAFLKASNPDENAPLGVKPEVMDNYVRSCAGYCVVTYILGIGDRHLENLLLSPDGHFFHADFGYILGQDPKPFPPLMKLPIQIIEGMGGLNNDNYKSFCQLCFITYITLRKNASLILNLVQLMINTSIPALLTSVENSESEKQELLWKVQEKFMLDMSDEEAVLHFQNLIDDSVNAFLPVVIDRLHSMAQYWRT